MIRKIDKATNTGGEQQCRATGRKKQCEFRYPERSNEQTSNGHTNICKILQKFTKIKSGATKQASVNSK